MKRFAELFEQIDQTQSTNEKVLYIRNYFASATDADAAWALFFLSGQRLKRLISSSLLLEWCCESSSTPLWLMEESYASVGDIAETIALLLPYKEEESNNPYALDEWMEKLIKPLQGLKPEAQKNTILSFWEKLSSKEIFILNKILTGSLRVGVSHLLTLKALSEAIHVSRESLSHRLMGSWAPTEAFFASLKLPESESNLNPYPFYLAYPLEDDIKSLGTIGEWLVEWKWDGIRAQAVMRKGESALWSRGNELISQQFPELIEAFQTVPSGTVLDGEVLAYQGLPLPFGELQKRLGRKNVSQAMIAKIPIVFIVYDILEYEDRDIRFYPLSERRKLLDQFIFDFPRILKSSEIECRDWDELLTLRKQSREKGVEGLMLKKRDSVYGVGRQKNFWWKYKVDPMTIDAVLLYAQPGSGQRANLFTDYTFAVWKDKELVPIAKAYSGLTQEEIHELDAWIRKNTQEKFGPVRQVKPFQVFEIAFANIQISRRHKSGVALRFPRIHRWRKDKTYEEADSLEFIKQTFLRLNSIERNNQTDSGNEHER